MPIQENIATKDSRALRSDVTLSRYQSGVAILEYLSCIFEKTCCKVRRSSYPQFPVLIPKLCLVYIPSLALVLL
ncbi:hypothetical protein AALO_G00181730 [Alosa alosa]|uniref:Uncharacterized protein n=1 Tax=Alosa alosa TaxID=278164 RepID=A0AAV6G8Z1_9TELE|nr:hypothetical protein AALO_G00181730 [Alosa alosa]